MIKVGQKVLWKEGGIEPHIAYVRYIDYGYPPLQALVEVVGNFDGHNGSGLLRSRNGWWVNLTDLKPYFEEWG